MGVDISIIKIADLSSVADYVLIVSGETERQVQAISTSIVDTLRDEGIKPLGTEGESAGHWILLDYDDLIIHVFLDEVRHYYDLDGMWSEAPKSTYSDEAPQALH